MISITAVFNNGLQVNGRNTTSTEVYTTTKNCKGQKYSTSSKRTLSAKVQLTCFVMYAVGPSLKYPAVEGSLHPVPGGSYL